MLRSYIKIGLRNLRKHSIFSVINIFGLSVSIAFCLLLYMHIRHEQSYDTFHKEKERIFRLEMTNLSIGLEPEQKKSIFSFATADDELRNSLTFPLVVAEDMPATFPEIETLIPLATHSDVLVRANNKIFKEKQLMFVGEEFFQVFNFPLEKGLPGEVLKGRKSVVLSASTARKYFGLENPIGKIIEITGDEPQLYTISGVAKDAPDNSSFQFDMVMPVKSADDYEYNVAEKFNHLNHQMIIQLKRGVDASAFTVKMNKWVRNYFAIPFFSDDEKDAQKKIDQMQWTLRPFADAHYSAASPWGHYTNARNIYQLSCIVIVILLIASLNYILLAVSNGAARSQEVGVRKVMGAGRGSVILQFWVETQIIVLIAVFIGFILAQLLLPVYNNLIGTSLSISDLSWGNTLLVLTGLCIVLGLLAGYYPALLLSKMRPASILKSFQTFKVNPRFSRILVVAQYSACIILMLAAFVINRQMQFVSHKDLGFDKEQVLLVSNSANDSVTALLKERLSNFAQAEPSLNGFAAMTGSLDGGGDNNGFKLNGEQKWLKQMKVDYDYFSLLKIPVVQGRTFSRDILSDTAKEVRPSVVNETLFKLLGSSARLGEFNETIRSTIIGVVKDYHFETLSKKIEPEQHVLLRKYIRYFMFRVKQGQTERAIARIGNTWGQLTSDYPFEFTFLDQSLATMYEPEQRWQHIIQASCFFAIIIACMGLFGLSAINAHNRTKEIGIRKVLGATVTDVVASLSKNFLLMVILAVIIAFPVAYWIMNKWLEDYAYRIEITWWMFALVGFAAIGIALITVSMQAIRAAIANPVDSLRTE